VKQIFIWFLGACLSGMGIATLISSFSLLKESFTSLFLEKDLCDCIIFTFLTIFLWVVGVSLFYIGYLTMENGL
jgi:hypothetical protein